MSRTVFAVRRPGGPQRLCTPKKSRALLTAAGLFLWAVPLTAQVVVNEFMASNDATVEDPDEPGQFADWVELYNAGGTTVDLSGAYLTDDLGEPDKWQFPEGILIGAGEYLVVWTDGNDEQGDAHTSFKLRAAGEDIGLFEADGLTPIDTLSFGQQETDVSFGRFPDGGDFWCRMTEPTPGAPNDACAAERARISRPGGTFVEPFEVEITCESPTAMIFYTLDRSEPDAGTGIEYTVPITISETTWVRARVVEPDLQPGPVVSETYLALDAAIANFESHLPIVVIDTFGHDIDREAGGARPFRPVMSVFIDTDSESGRARITDSPDYAGHAAMHVRGASTSSYPKKQYRLETWDESGADRAVPLLGFPRESDWILHAPYSDKTLMRNFLMYKWSNDIGRYAVGSRFVELYEHDDGDGVVSERDYRGVYILMETIKRDENRVDIARLEPAHDTEPEITGGYLLQKGGDGGAFQTRTYNDRLSYVDPSAVELTSAQKDWIRGYFNEFEEALSGPDFADPEIGYYQYVDVDSFIDHHLMVEMSRNVDGFVQSTFLYKDRGGKINMGPIWDYNGSLGGANYFCSCQIEGWQHEFNERNCPECREGNVTFALHSANNSYRWYARLFRDSGFERRYAERWFELREGPFSTESLMRDIDETAAFLTDNGAEDNPVDRNFARWRVLNAHVWPNFKVLGDFHAEVDWLKEWLTARLEWMDSVLIVPPQLSRAGGRVGEPFDLEISAPDGEIYFTLNGPDPRAEDGTIAPEAVAYSGPIPIAENTLVRARVQVSDGSWSNLVEERYSLNLPTLAISEIMYNPANLRPEEGVLFSRTNFEFVEIVNYGEEPVDLVGLTLFFRDRVAYEFSESDGSLGPGEYLVTPQRLEAFTVRYKVEGINIAGAYSGFLANSTMGISIGGPLGEEVMSVEYVDSWHPSTDGDGYSLVLTDPRTPPELWNDPSSWTTSAEVDGSPGRPEGASGGLQRPGDITQDSKINITDVVGLLRYIFGRAPDLPCASEVSNERLLNVDGDGVVDVTDALHLFNYLFRRGMPAVLGVDCVSIEGCPEACDAGS